MIEEIKIPDIGESVEAADVVKVLVKVGDVVVAEQGIVELETDKAVVELPSPKAGKITEMLVKEGDVVKPGQVIGKIDVEADASATAEVAAPKPEIAAEAEIAEPTPLKTEPAEPKEKKSEPAPPPPPSGKAAAAAPSVRRLARELGVAIEHVGGTGPGGRIMPEDIKNYVKLRMSADKPAIAQKPLPDFSKWGRIVCEPMTKVRKLTSKSMTQAWTTVPHVTQFDEADISLAEEFRHNFGKRVESAGGKLTVTSLLLKVVATALQEFPKFNASIDPQSEELILKQYYHIGMAVDTERGLLVPVIRDVDQKNITELAIELTRLAERARTGKVSVDELEGGSFTISNQGSIGGTNFTPIVYWPQVAILGVSRGKRQQVWKDGEFAARMIMPLSLSYDHRIIDGAEAARFLRWVCQTLEQPFALHL
jgi:pyruvate dehydrogenase E2 component (dihydrolipoamide acetyltransferase)